MNDQIITFAKAYIQRGWGITPVRPPIRDNPKTGKSPIRNSWQLYPIKDCKEAEETWSKKNYNIGILTGNTSGIVVLDFDKAEIFTEWSKLHPDAVNTYTVRRNNAEAGRCHLYFSIPTPGCVTKSIRGDGWDFQSNGTHVVAPPSEHYTGGIYQCIKDVPLLPWDDSLLEKLPISKSPPVNISDNTTLPTIISSGAVAGQRNTTAFDFACKLRDSKLPQSKAIEKIKAFADSCIPPLPQTEAIATVNSAYSIPARPTTEALPDWVGNKGYTLIPRSIFDLPLAPEYKLVYSYLIAKAAFTDMPYYIRGQLLTNYETISQSLNIDSGKIKNIMRKLRDDGYIQSVRKQYLSLITVNNYSALQNSKTY